MRTYLEISISADLRHQELLIPTMIELGCQGFQQTDDALLCYVDKNHWSDGKYHILQDDLKNILQTISANAAVRMREIQHENWNAE